MTPNHIAYIDIKKYEVKMEQDSFIDDLVKQNSWFAKNIVQLLGELSKFKLASHVEKPFTVSALNIDSHRSSRANLDKSDIYVNTNLDKSEIYVNTNQKSAFNTDRSYKYETKSAVDYKRQEELQRTIDDQKQLIKDLQGQIVDLKRSLEIKSREIKDLASKDSFEMVVEKQNAKIGNLIIDNDNLSMRLGDKIKEVQMLTQKLGVVQKDLETSQRVRFELQASII
jgi:hypothetical protein